MLKKMRRIRDHIFVLCFLILEFGWERVIAQNCNNQTVQLCLSYLSDAGLDIGHVDDDLPSWNETEITLRSRCKAFGGFSECMRDEVDQCASKERGLYTGWIAAYNFLCKQSNLSVVAEYMPCFASVVSSMEYQCQKNFKSKVFILTNGTSTISSDKLADYCKLANTFFVCLNNTLTVDCEPEAASWQWTWDQKLNGALIAQCQGSADSNTGSNDQHANGWTIALIIVLVLISVVMVIAITFLVVFLFRKRKESSRIRQVRRRTNAAAVPPPPYSAVLYSSSEPGAEPQAHLVDSSVVIRTGNEGGQETAVHPPTDVYLPPPYMGEMPPAPSYETIEEAKAVDDSKTEGNSEEENSRKREKEEEEKKEKERRNGNSLEHAANSPDENAALG